MVRCSSFAEERSKRIIEAYEEVAAGLRLIKRRYKGRTITDRLGQPSEVDLLSMSILRYSHHISLDCQA